MNILIAKTAISTFYQRRIGLYLLFSAAFILLFYFVPELCYAQTSAYGVSISPSVVEIKAEQDTKLNQTFTIKNISQIQQTFKIKFMRVISSSTAGEVTVLKPDIIYNKVFQNISISIDGNTVNSITLLAKQEKKMVITIELTKQMPTQDYYFTLVLQSENLQPSAKESSSMVSYGAGSIILLERQRIKNSGLRISDFSTDFFRTKGPIKINATLSNSGKQYVKPSGILTIKNMFGTVVDQARIDPPIILPEGKSDIYINSSLNSNFTNAQRTELNLGNYQTITWDDNFLFGLYSAELQIRPSSDISTISARTYFLVLPVYTIIPVTILVLLLIRFYLRVKRKII